MRVHEIVPKDKFIVYVGNKCSDIERVPSNLQREFDGSQQGLGSPVDASHSPRGGLRQCADKLLLHKCHHGPMVNECFHRPSLDGQIYAR